MDRVMLAEKYLEKNYRKYNQVHNFKNYHINNNRKKI